MEYKTARWRALRESVLARDGWLCRECRRYGRRTEASVVHHAWPADLYPEYRWQSWNLLALCPACHNAMHVRHSDELSERGTAWMRRCRPPEARQPPRVRILDAPVRGPVGGTLSNPGENLPGGGLSQGRITGGPKGQPAINKTEGTR